MVIATASWLVKEFGANYVTSEARLLAFRCADVEYGLEFLANMMMQNAKVACSASPAFLLSGIEGGIQEQAVRKALGAAWAATSATSQKIAGDAVQSLRCIQKEKRKGL
uniref:Uncharacterized protein n=1 Tax=Amphora coffeiformis TaxID=265554 RepID=A0A7S3L8K1_9STRA|mmetsp:Transcript_136/g.235  ORF Transcript_136/g.235 Transcript_136/m.235 type:complete len:109 (-) Transcript_136:21-347(-)|eukprot:scaffold3077_cov162-Amphora_coffeaeformis.AAC.1